MKVLFLNTSNSNLVIGIVDSDKLVYEGYFEDIKEHSKYLISSIEKGFRECNLKPNDIDKLIVIEGPGSFTGLRIGITVTKVYGFALNKQVLGISSLKALALSTPGYDYIIPIIDARGGYVFGAIYDRNYNTILDEQHTTLDNLKDKVKELDGNFIFVYNDNLFDDQSFNDYNHRKIKLDVLKIVNYYKNDKGVNPHELNPKYLKLSQAEENINC